MQDEVNPAVEAAGAVDTAEEEWDTASESTLVPEAGEEVAVAEDVEDEELEEAASRGTLADVWALGPMALSWAGPINKD